MLGQILGGRCAAPRLEVDHHETALVIDLQAVHPTAQQGIAGAAVDEDLEAPSTRARRRCSSLRAWITYWANLRSMVSARSLSRSDSQVSGSPSSLHLRWICAAS